MRRADEAENDDTEQHPWGVARKELAEGGKHLVKIGQSKHRIPLFLSILKGNVPDVCSPSLATMLSGQTSTSPGKFENF